MSFNIRRIEYFYAIVEDEPGAAYGVLSELANLGINLLAFGGSPTGPSRTQLQLFPEDSALLTAVADRARLDLDGPHGAILVQGDDELGALAGVHKKLADKGVGVYSSMGVGDGHGRYGYVVYVRAHDMERALQALDL